MTSIYCFHKAVSLVFFDTSCQIKTPVDAFTIEGGCALIKALSTYLSESRHSRSEAMDYLSAYIGSNEKAIQLIRFLESKHVLTESSTRETSTNYDAVLDYLNRNASSLDDPHTPLMALRETNVICLQGEGRVVEIAATLLQEKGFQITSVESDAQLLVYVGYQESTAVSLEKNRHFYHLNRPFLMANASGTSLFLGPLVIPRLSSCYHCFYQRSYANANYKQEYLAGCDGNGDTVRSVDTMLATLYAGVLANEIYKIRQRDTDCLLIDKTLEIQLTEFSSTVRPIVKAPRCEVCGKQNTRPLQAVRNMM